MATTPPDVKSIFGKALELPEGPARVAYLDLACGGDANLRVEVEGLLAALDRADRFLNRPLVADGTMAPAVPAASTGTFDSGESREPLTTEHHGQDEGVGVVIAGKYKLVEPIGEGGMGSVFLAQQTEPVKRLVAIKLIKAGMDSKAVLARFDAERQALAMMDHPNIARVLDAGTTESGRSFFVMELVKGVPITQFCDERRLTPRQRLELFVPVCLAIQHAHQKGIIHRDIKPSNVLVALYDDRPVPKVIDFGVAKATGPQLTEYTLVTGLGAVVGTPEYMSPEQATFNQLDVDTRSDIYSLGVLLYELLTGTTPIDRKSLGKAALLEVLRIVREVEALRPSNKLSSSDALPSISANRGLEPRKLTGLLRGELDWIVLKALEKDRARRYETANGFAADVQRYLAGEQVQAVPPSASYRLRKFFRKNRGMVTAAAVILLALTLGIVGTGWGLVEARQQRDHAENARGLEAEQRAKVEEREKLLERQTTLLEERTKEAETARHEADLELHDNQRTLLSQAWEASENAKLRTLLDRMRPKRGRPDLRGFETHLLDRVTHPEMDCVKYQVREGELTQELLAQYLMPGRIRLTHTPASNQHYYSIDALDLKTGKPAAGFAPIRGRWNHPQVARFVALVPGDPPRIFAAGHTTPSTFVTADPNEPIAFQLPQHEITLWDARTGQQLAHCERLIPDAALASQGWRHRFISGMINTGEMCSRDTSRVLTQMVRVVKSEPNTPRVFETRLQVHDLKSGRAVLCLDPRPGVMERAYFSFDDKFIVTSHEPPGQFRSRLFTVWDAATGREVWSRVANFRGFTIDGLYVAFESPVPPAAGTEPRPMKVNRLDTGEPVELPKEEIPFLHPPPPDDMWRDIHPRLNQASARPERVWGTVGNLSLEAPRPWHNERGEVVAVEADRGQPPPGQDRVTTYTVTTCRPARLDVYPHPGRTPVSHVSYRRTPAGSQLVATGKFTHWFSDSVALRWLETLDLESGARTSVVLAPYPAEPFSLGPGAHLVVKGDTVLVHYGSRHEYDLERPVRAPWGWFSPDPAVPEFIVFDLRTGRQRFAHLVGWAPITRGGFREGYVTADVPVGVSPDGTSVAMIPRVTELQLLNAVTGNPRWKTPLPSEKPSGYWSPLFTPDGSRIVLVGAASRLILVVDAATGELLRQIPDVFEKPDQPGVAAIKTIQLTPDGRLVLCASVRGDLAVIDPVAGVVRHRIVGARSGAFPNPSVPPPSWHLGPEQLSDRFVLKHDGTEYEVWDFQAGTLVSRFDLKLARGVRECRFSEDVSRLFVLSNDIVHVVDLRRGREVLKIPRGVPSTQDPTALPRAEYPSHMSLSADGSELTVYTAYSDSGTVARRVYDGRPLTPEELTRAQRVHDIRTRPPAPLPGTNPGPKPPVTASDYFDVAKRLQGSDPKGSMAAYREAIRRDPEFAVLHGHLARALESGGDLDGALEAYRVAVRLAPRDLDSHWRMGLILERRGDYAGAAAAQREALRNDTRNGVLDAGVETYTGAFPPSRATLHNALGYALRELGELEEAEREFREAIRLDRQPHWFVTNLGVCLIRQGKLKETADEVDALLKRLEDSAGKNPKSSQGTSFLAQVTLDIGAMYLWEQRNEEAERWNGRATKLFTDYYANLPPGEAVPDTQKQLRHTHWRRSVALHRQDRSAEAIAELDLALKYFAEQEKLPELMLRTRYVAKAGDHKEAAATIEQLLEKPPTDGSLRWFYWNGLLGYAQCFDAAKGNEKLQREYADKAIALLRKAVAEGLDAGVFRGLTDPDLDPIRDRADLKAIVAELEKKFPLPKVVAPPPREAK